MILGSPFEEAKWRMERLSEALQSVKADPLVQQALDVLDNEPQTLKEAEEQYIKALKLVYYVLKDR